MTVVDISNHQGTAIDWNRARPGLSGLYMKLTESTGYTDPAWATNYANAAGIPRGAYHFCGSSIAQRYGDAVAEANHFADVYLSRKWELRPAYDIEMSGASPAWLGTFRAQFRRRTGVTADRVYTSQSLITGPLRPDLWLGGADTDLWIARYGQALGFTHPKLALWQYTSSGNWPGFPGAIDLSREMNAWNAPAASAAAPQPTTPVVDEESIVEMPAGSHVVKRLFASGRPHYLWWQVSGDDANKQPNKVTVHNVAYIKRTPANSGGAEYGPVGQPGYPKFTEFVKDRPGPIQFADDVAFVYVEYSCPVDSTAAIG